MTFTEHAQQTRELMCESMALACAASMRACSLSLEEHRHYVAPPASVWPDWRLVYVSGGSHEVMRADFPFPFQF